MKSIEEFLSESIELTQKVPYVIHKHNPRSGSEHYDLRFLSSIDKKLLHSFACPTNFLTTINTKSILVKTRDHDPRWLTLKSYRLEEVESGEVEIEKEVKNGRYFLLIFHGKVLKGSYHLLKLKSKKRVDYWLLIKKK